MATSTAQASCLLYQKQSVHTWQQEHSTIIWGTAIGVIQGTTIGVRNVDTRSLDYGSYRGMCRGYIGVYGYTLSGLIWSGLLSICRG